nr:Hsp20/alpha crystallin family protein [Desulfatibacillum aliphaticivorans]
MIMDAKKLAPWNWFKKELEEKNLPIVNKNAEQAVQPQAPLAQLHSEIDRMFDDVFRSFGMPGLGTGWSLPALARDPWIKPTLDISAADKEYQVSVELPGMEEKDIHLELDKDVLRISGEKKQEIEEKGKNHYRMERSYGSFQRVLSLPNDADQDGIKASYKNGVMKISIPRKEAPASTGRKIEVSAA